MVNGHPLTAKQLSRHPLEGPGVYVFFFQEESDLSMQRQNAPSTLLQTEMEPTNPCQVAYSRATKGVGEKGSDPRGEYI